MNTGYFILQKPGGWFTDDEYLSLDPNKRRVEWVDQPLLATHMTFDKARLAFTWVKNQNPWCKVRIRRC